MPSGLPVLYIYDNWMWYEKENVVKKGIAKPKMQKGDLGGGGMLGGATRKW